MKNYLKINWPKLSEEEHQKMIDCFHNNLEYVHKPRPATDNNNLIHQLKSNNNQTAGFYHLYDFPNFLNFFRDLFKNYNIDEKYINCFSIQRSLISVAPHCDPGRKFVAYYLIKGLGETVFYSSKNFIPRNSYHNKLEDLTEIERVSLNVGDWYLFNTYEIHGVVNMSTVRYSLAFDITKIFDNYEDAFDKIKDLKVFN